MRKPSELQRTLRNATQEVHERLHRHPGLAAVAEGTISLPEYRRLLARLWGFHAAFERGITEAARAGLIETDLTDRRRAPLLVQDLRSLGATDEALRHLPLCEGLHRPRTRAGVLGSLYVIEGSTLGGTVLARALAPVTGDAPEAARRFFLGYGEANGVRWRELLTRLERLSEQEGAEAQAVAGAVATFGDFENWMSQSS